MVKIQNMKLTTHRQVTVPKEVCQHYGFDARCEVEWIKEKNGPRLVKKSDAPNPFAAQIGAWKGRKAARQLLKESRDHGAR